MGWLLAGYSRILLRVWIPLPGRRAHRQICLAGSRAPFWARLGTYDLHVLEEIYFRGEYESVVSELTDSPKLIVDLGANVGYSLRYWLQHFPEATVIAVEPNAENARLCRMNMQAGGHEDRVVLVEGCVGANERVVHLETQYGDWAFHMVEGTSGAAIGIPVKTVPQILKCAGALPPIDLIKCDIEGAEAELFSNCADWINRVRNLVVELHPPPYSEGAFLQDLSKAGAKFEIVSRSKSLARPVLLLSNRAVVE